MVTITRKVQLRVLLIISALVITYAFYALYQVSFESWNSRIIDHFFSLRSRIKPLPVTRESHLVHVDANLNAFRSQHAQVIRNLFAMDVGIIAFDTIFSKRVGDEEDLPLVTAVEQVGNVILGVDFDLANPPSRAKANQLDVNQKRYLDSTKWNIAVNGTPDRFIKANDPIMTYPELASASRGLGFLNVTPDPDGILRRIPLLVRYADAFYPSIALQAVCQYLGVSPQKIILQPGRAIILKDARRAQRSGLQDLIIPIDATGNLILNYTQSWEKIRHFSYREILLAHETTETLQKMKKDFSGKIVVMSEAVEAPFKIRSVGADINFPSGTIHSIVMQNILQGSFLRKLSWPEMVIIEIVLLMILLFTSVRFSAPVLSFGTVVLSSLYFLIGAFSFIYFHLIFQIARPLLMLFCALFFILIANTVERAILLAETERARRLAERELEIGHEIQSGFFPDTLPVIDGWELAAYFKAARHVSGDFYDAFMIGGKKTLAIVVADVCDKGVGAALFMALFRSLIRVLSGSTDADYHSGNSSSFRDPAEVLQHTIRSVNNYISTTHEAESMFATIFFGFLNPDSGVMHYINAGHEPPMIIGAEGAKPRLYPTGPAVGLFPNAAFDVLKIKLEPGDVLLAYTDGVVDAQSIAGERFTKYRLKKLVAASVPSATSLIDKISDQIKNHNTGQQQYDDITILALRRNISS